MGNFTLIQCSGPEELAKEAAHRWLRAVSVSERSGQTFSVALAGGRIAGRFFQQIAAQAAAADRRLARVHFFWSDERCVAPEDEQSNFSIAQERLFKPLAIDASQIHRLLGELPSESALALAAGELRDYVPFTADGQPVFDLVLLGMGEEGHVASLFPGEPPEVVNSRAVFRAVVTPKPPPNRLTLGYPAIQAARQVWVLASGKGKEAALAESVAPDGHTPLARVLQMRPHSTVFSDIPIRAAN